MTAAYDREDIKWHKCMNGAIWKRMQRLLREAPPMLDKPQKNPEQGSDGLSRGEWLWRDERMVRMGNPPRLAWW